MGVSKSDTDADSKRVGYKVLIGFDTPTKRYEVGQTAKDLTPHEVKVLLEARAIEAK